MRQGQMGLHACMIDGKLYVLAPGLTTPFFPLTEATNPKEVAPSLPNNSCVPFAAPCGAHADLGAHAAITSVQPPRPGVSSSLELLPWELPACNCIGWAKAVYRIKQVHNGSITL